MWGTEYAAAFLAWTRTLTWKEPGPATAPYLKGKVPLGISWLELAINFCLMTQQWIPLPTGAGQHAAFRVQSFTLPQKPANVSFQQMALATLFNPGLEIYPELGIGPVVHHP